MIYNDKFVWLHLPKTGGTTVHNLFKDMGIPGLHVDDNNSKTKHDSLERREETGWVSGQRKPFITFRRLEDWLISDWMHKKTWMGARRFTIRTCSIRTVLLLRLGGTWVAADWWIQYFQIDDSFTFLRLEYLEEDINKKLIHYVAGSTKSIKINKKDNKNQNREQLSGEEKIHADCLNQIKLTNPKWASIEAKLYKQ